MTRMNAEETSGTGLFPAAAVVLAAAGYAVFAFPGHAEILAVVLLASLVRAVFGFGDALAALIADLTWPAVRAPDPARPLIPDIPPGLGIPAPTTMEYVDQYMRYWITDQREKEETYTYGERLTNPKINEVSLGVNPVEEVIKMYKTHGAGTNQATGENGTPGPGRGSSSKRPSASARYPMPV